MLLLVLPYCWYWCFITQKKERCWNILTLIIFFPNVRTPIKLQRKHFNCEANTTPDTDIVQLLEICCSMFFDFQSKSNGTRSNVKVTDRWLFGKHLCFIWLRWIIIIILCSASGELELKCLLYHLWHFHKTRTFLWVNQKDLLSGYFYSVDVWTCTASILHLVAISMDRYLCHLAMKMRGDFLTGSLLFRTEI